MQKGESDVFDLFSEIYTSAAQEELSLQEYLLACRDDKSLYATAQERMVEAIGEPTLIDTSADERLGRIFANRTVKIYPSFADFYGMEDTIERIVGYFRYAAQGLAGSFIVKMVGSYSNVVGLPLYETVNLLQGEGFPIHFGWLNS